MTREGIYVDGKKITQRYIGNRLVWERARLLFTGSYGLSKTYNQYQLNFTVPNKITASHLKKISINGKILANVTLTVRYSTTVLIDFANKTDFDNFWINTLGQRVDSTFYSSANIHVWGN